MRFDAIVAGAGPAGGVAARLLAAGGWNVALVEKDPFPRRKVCGEFLSAPTEAVLDACGVGDAFRAAAGPMVRRIGLFSGDTVVTARHEKDWGRALGREHLDTMLRDAATAAGARLFQPATLLSVDREGEVQVCRLKTPGGDIELVAPTVIAATGSWRTRPPFAVAAPPRGGDLLAFKAHFAGGALPSGLMPLLAFPGGYGGLVASDANRLSLSCCVRRDALAALRRPGERAGDAVLRHLRATTRGIAAALDGAQLQDDVLAAGPIRPRLRPRCAQGVFFTGNLAGEAHPVIAEGISIAMQGSFLLARLLLAREAGAAAAYGVAWRRQFGPRLAWASLFAHAAMAARRPTAMLVKTMPVLLSWGAQFSGKTARASETPIHTAGRGSGWPGRPGRYGR
jgi:flavin-dependent dehydrogenase